MRENIERGVSDGILTKLILTMPILTIVSPQVEEFRGVSFTTSEHHTDAKNSRILLYNEDVLKLVDWFEFHDPFPIEDFVMSISNLHSNCYRAFECDIFR
ncbi:hypothetical protein AVEN_94953-1 [Araneus ventricosus]|uniref:Uncharacterized protein n=1 Tax=Araneus ventricosus TaxID=182803 RepID=A0A4Y2DKW8_ARAVE|nr:hypothetical protein AVEN_94953-1 [Araneus ventricosus]